MYVWHSVHFKFAFAVRHRSLVLDYKNIFLILYHPLIICAILWVRFFFFFWRIWNIGFVISDYVDSSPPKKPGDPKNYYLPWLGGIERWDNNDTTFWLKDQFKGRVTSVEFYLISALQLLCLYSGFRLIRDHVDPPSLVCWFFYYSKNSKTGSYIFGGSYWQFRVK